MTVADIESYLVSKGLQVKQATDNNVHVACPFCREDPSKRGRLYIGLEPPGPFYCHLCGEKGTLRKLQRFYGDDPTEFDDSEWEDSYQLSAIWNDAAEYCQSLLRENDDVLLWLITKRGLTAETIENHQLGWADGTLGKYLRQNHSLEDIKKLGLIDKFNRDFLFSHVTIPYHMNGNVVLIRGKDMGGKYLTPPGAKTRLYNSDVTFDSANTEFLVCEGEFDSLIAEQSGYAAVAAPGVVSWQASWNGYFADAKRIYIVFDGDEPGRRGAEKVALALGPASRIVAMPDDTDITDYIVTQGHQKEEFDLLLHRAKGGSLLTVWDAYAEWEEVHQVPGLRLGYERVDAAIRPGLLPWQILVMLAKTNVGKTIFTLNLFHRMCMLNPTLKILFVSLEQTRSEWFDRARKIYQFYNLDAEHDDVLTWFESRFMMIDKNRVSEHELVQNIEQFQYELGDMPSLIAVDYLGYWARSYKGEAYERTTAAIMAMKALSKEYRIPFVTPHQVNRGTRFGEEPEVDSGKESGAVEETADFVFTLFATDQNVAKRAADRTQEITLRIGKSRHGGVGTQEKMILAPKSLAIVPVDDVLADRAKAEMKFPGLTFEEMIEMHKTGTSRMRFYSGDS